MNTTTDKELISAKVEVSVTIDRKSWEAETGESFTVEALTSEVTQTLSGAFHATLPDAKVVINRQS